MTQRRWRRVISLDFWMFANLLSNSRRRVAAIGFVTSARLRVQIHRRRQIIQNSADVAHEHGSHKSPLLLGFHVLFRPCQ